MNPCYSVVVVVVKVFFEMTKVYDGIMSHLELLDCQTQKIVGETNTHTHQQLLLLASLKN